MDNRNKEFIPTTGVCFWQGWGGWVGGWGCGGGGEVGGGDGNTHYLLSLSLCFCCVRVSFEIIAFPPCRSAQVG